MSTKLVKTSLHLTIVSMRKGHIVKHTYLLRKGSGNSASHHFLTWNLSTVLEFEQCVFVCDFAVVVLAYKCRYFVIQKQSLELCGS